MNFFDYLVHGTLCTYLIMIHTKASQKLRTLKLMQRNIRTSLVMTSPEDKMLFLIKSYVLL